MDGAEEDRTPRPWMIKNIPENVRDRATMAAHRVDLTLGDYVTQALTEKLARDRAAGRQRPETFDPLANLDAIERMVALSMQLKDGARSDEAVAAHDRLTRSIYALMSRRVKAISEVGHTKLLAGPAAEPDSQPAEPPR